MKGGYVVGREETEHKGRREGRTDETQYGRKVKGRRGTEKEVGQKEEDIKRVFQRLS